MKLSKKIICCLMACSLLSGYSVTAAGDTAFKRIYGSSNIETSIEIAKELHSSSNTYVIATVEDYPDALAGTILAAKYNAPILFVSQNDNEKVFNYLSNINVNKSTKFYILGGTGAVSQLVEDTLKSVSNNVTRLGGSTRFETCKLINDALEVRARTPVIVVTGYNYPDALSMSAIGGQLQYPILLVNKDILPETAAQQLKSISPSTVYIAGGTGVVSSKLEQQIKNLIPTTTVRLAGSDRYDTSMKIADYFKDKLYTDVYVTGRDFHDALAAAPLAASKKASLLLVDNDSYKNQYSVSKHTGTIIGDKNKISASVESYLSSGAQDTITAPTVSDTEILNILNNAQDSFFSILRRSSSVVVQDKNATYFKLAKDYDSPAKLEAYLKHYWSSDTTESFIQFIGAGYIGETYCMHAGDIGFKYNILSATITKNEQSGDKVYVTLKVNTDDSASSAETRNYVLKYENNKWVVDYFEGTFGDVGEGF